MKVFHITPSYKPAYVYGGPIMSVAKLCEALTNFQKSVKKPNFENAFFSPISPRQNYIDHESKADNYPKQYKFVKDYRLSVQVFTTTANGNEELAVTPGEPVVVENVSVIYFNRWTKDHSHFSPGLLWGLRKEIKNNLKFITHEDKISNANKKQIPFKKEKPLAVSEVVIHIHSWWNLVSIFSCLIAMWYNVPVVLSPRGMLTSYSQSNRSSFSKKIIHLLLGKKLLRYVHIHSTSDQEKQDVLKIIKPKSIRVISNLVRIENKQSHSENLVSTSRFQEGVFKLIFLSRIEQKKGLGLLFDALSLLDLPWTLTIGGTGDEGHVENLRIKADRLKIDDRITWLGQVSNENKFELMTAHDLLVLTSYNENFANVVIESLSVGTPVLLSDKVGLAEYVKDTGLGWISTLNPVDIVEKILNAFHNKLKRESIRTQAPTIIERDFDDKILTKRYLSLYHDVLNHV